MTEILRICIERLIKIKKIPHWNSCSFINIQTFKIVIHHLSCVFIQLYFTHYLSFSTDIFNTVIQSMSFCHKEGNGNPFNRDTAVLLLYLQWYLGYQAGINTCFIALAALWTAAERQLLPWELSSWHTGWINRQNQERRTVNHKGMFLHHYSNHSLLYFGMHHQLS